MPSGELKAFISYSHKDRRLARDIKNCLVGYGLDVFLAHDDIQPSAEWAREIKARLESADVFLPLLTDNFPQSKWTDQESGMALAGGKLIVPLKVDIDPYGFIAAIQATKVDPAKTRPACARVARVIGRHPQYRERFLDGLIRMFSDSGTFDQAGAYAEDLLSFEMYSPQQLREVLLAITKNDQIYKSFRARRALETFIERHARDMDKSLIGKARKLLRS